MQQQPTQFQALRILYLSLVSGMIAFILVAWYIVSQRKLEPIVQPGMKQILAVSIISAAAVLVILAFYIFNKKLISLQALDFKTRMEKYRTASIIRWAMIEFPVMLSIITYMLSADQLYLALSAILLGVFLTVRPARSSISREINISEEEVENM